MNNVSQKFVKNIAILWKVLEHVNEATIKSTYYTIFHSHISYSCPAWGQKLNSKHGLELLGEKMWIISSASFNAHAFPIFAESKIFEFPDLISLFNCLFIYQLFVTKSPAFFFHVLLLKSKTRSKTRTRTKH